MFGTLQDYRDPEYYEAHPVIYLLTPTQNYRIDLLSGYTTSDTDAETYIIPSTQEERDEVCDMAQRRSSFRAETELEDGERLITFSTCAYDYDGARYVLVGVLREIEL